VSHSKERLEKICLNCNTGLQGRFCHKCGQENIEPKDTVWGFVSHFFYDITHFDGKFFYTVSRLIAKPGFLPKEYITGKRARYLHPIRMYIFSSAIFFLFFFSMINTSDISLDNDEGTIRNADSAKIAVQQTMLKEAKTREDSAFIESGFKNWSKLNPGARKDTSAQNDKKGLNVSFKAGDYTSKAQYDSAQKNLPEDDRDGWLQRKIKYRGIELNQRYKNDETGFFRELIEKFIHSFPYLLFVSLPLYALFLKLLYIRRRKKFYYVDHGLFLLYLYIFTFLLMLVFFSLIKLMNAFDWDWLGWVLAALILYGIYYAFRSMKVFYGQSGGKTLLKFILFNILTSFSALILFAIFFLLTVFRV
jgi:hypothetical protein